MGVDHEEADAPLPTDFADIPHISRLASDSDSSSNASDIIAGRRFSATENTDIQADITAASPITFLETCDPQDQRSESKAHWEALIGNLLEQGWRVAFSDGTGREGHYAAGLWSSDRRGGTDRADGAYLGELATVHDAELLGITLALEREETATLAILTDSTTALDTVRKGAPPRSQIESRLNQERPPQETRVSPRHDDGVDKGTPWRHRQRKGRQGGSLTQPQGANYYPPQHEP